MKGVLCNVYGHNIINLPLKQGWPLNRSSLILLLLLKSPSTDGFLLPKPSKSHRCFLVMDRLGIIERVMYANYSYD